MLFKTFYKCATVDIVPPLFLLFESFMGPILNLEAKKQVLIDKLKNNLEDYVFLFDYDGTLYSSSVEGIENAYLQEPKIKHLEELSKKVDIAIVTGRSVANILEKSRLDDSKIEFFGNHGCEAWDSENKTTLPVNEEVMQAKKEIDELRKQLNHLLEHNNIILEDKVFALSYYAQDWNEHCAQLNQVKDEIKSLYEQLENYILYERPIRIEIAPEVVHKGQGVKYIHNKYPGKKILFAGDAENDIAAIEELKKEQYDSISVSIGSDIAHVGADYQLESSQDLWDILNALN